ncbi:hypothetical protein ACQPYE_17865 [Actinosynnema sp. CA-299493]
MQVGDDPELGLDRHVLPVRDQGGPGGTRRKPNTDTLATMSRHNFAELCDTVRSPAVRLERACDTLLDHRWMPLHAMVTNTTIPYAQAQDPATRQHRLLKLAVLTTLAAAGTVVHHFRWRR